MNTDLADRASHAPSHPSREVHMSQRAAWIPPVANKGFLLNAAWRGEREHLANKWKTVEGAKLAGGTERCLRGQQDATIETAILVCQGSSLQGFESFCGVADNVVKALSSRCEQLRLHTFLRGAFFCQAPASGTLTKVSLFDLACSETEG